MDLQIFSFPLWLAPAVVCWRGPPVLPVLLYHWFGSLFQVPVHRKCSIRPCASYDSSPASTVHFNEQREQYFSTNSTFPRYHQEMITMPLRHIWRYMFKFWLRLHCHRVSVDSLSTSPGQAPRHMHCEQKAILFDYKTSKKETAKRSGQRSESLLIQWPSDLNWWASRDASSIALSGFRFDFRRRCNRPR